MPFRSPPPQATSSSPTGYDLVPCPVRSWACVRIRHPRSRVSSSSPRCLRSNSRPATGKSVLAQYSPWFWPHPNGHPNRWYLPSKLDKPYALLKHSPRSRQRVPNSCVSGDPFRRAGCKRTPSRGRPIRRQPAFESEFVSLHSPNMSRGVARYAFVQ